MKVNNPLLNIISNRNNETSSNKTSDVQSESSEIISSNNESALSSEISISKEAELMKKASEKMKETEEIDIEKVNRIKNLLAKGEYSIDNEALSKSIFMALKGGDHDE